MLTRETPLAAEIDEITNLVKDLPPDDFDSAVSDWHYGYIIDGVLMRMSYLQPAVAAIEQQNAMLTAEIKNMREQLDRLRGSRNAMLLIAGVAATVLLLWPEALGITREVGFSVVLAAVVYYLLFKSR